MGAEYKRIKEGVGRKVFSSLAQNGLNPPKNRHQFAINWSMGIYREITQKAFCVRTQYAKIGFSSISRIRTGICPY